MFSNNQDSTLVPNRRRTDVSRRSLATAGPDVNDVHSAHPVNVDQYTGPDNEFLDVEKCHSANVDQTVDLTVCTFSIVPDTADTKQNWVAVKNNGVW